jgi:hypothetical protein
MEGERRTAFDYSVACKAKGLTCKTYREKCKSTIKRSDLLRVVIRRLAGRVGGSDRWGYSITKYRSTGVDRIPTLMLPSNFTIPWTAGLECHDLN